MADIDKKTKLYIHFKTCLWRIIKKNVMVTKLSVYTMYIVILCKDVNMCANNAMF